MGQDDGVEDGVDHDDDDDDDDVGHDDEYDDDDRHHHHHDEAESACGEIGTVGRTHGWIAPSLFLAMMIIIKMIIIMIIIMIIRKRMMLMVMRTHGWILVRLRISKSCQNYRNCTQGCQIMYHHHDYQEEDDVDDLHDGASPSGVAVR